ncbi:hypothetical protein, partial [Mycobacterium avium]|uniref:hypothetical protein n=1 Tax=Mycobacterium avium TaxID=1764 RepID=UPI001F44B7E1
TPRDAPNGEEARFRYVNVAQWTDQAAFSHAQSGMMRRFADESLDRVGYWKTLGINMNAATFHPARRFYPPASRPSPTQGTTNRRSM